MIFQRLFLFLAFGLLVLGALGQGDTINFVEGESFKGQPIVPFCYNDECSAETMGKRFAITSQLNKRQRVLDFYRKMAQISEPSTISTVTNWTWHTDAILNKKPMTLNADVKFPVAIGGKRWGGECWLSSVHLIPHFKVRILQDDPNFLPPDTSGPVRTPSYLPGVKYFGAPAKCWGKELKNRDSVYIHPYLSFHAYHHSNGQDGQEFNPDGTINAYNGNFDEKVIFEITLGNIFEWYSKNPGYRSGEKNVFRNKDFMVKPGMARTVRTRDREEPDRQFGMRIGYEVHPRSILKNSLRNEKLHALDILLQQRIRTQWSYSIIPGYRDVIYSDTQKAFIAVTEVQSKELFRFVLNFDYIIGPYKRGDLNGVTKATFTDRVNVDLTIHYRIPGTPHAGLFVQAGYYASDNYNIYFQQSMFVLRGGLSIAFFKFPKKGDYDG